MRLVQLILFSILCADENNTTEEQIDDDLIKDDATQENAVEAVVENQLPVMRVNTEVPHSPTALKDAIKQLKWKEIFISIFVEYL